MGRHKKEATLERGTDMPELRDLLSKAVLTVAVAGAYTLMLFLIALVYHALK